MEIINILNASDLISIISILLSSLISILSLIFAWKEKKHQYMHTEKYSEWKDTCDVFSQFIMSSTISKLDNYLRRAAASASNESVSEFFALTEIHIETLELWTVRVLSTKEIKANTEVCSKVKALNEFHKNIVIKINNLKSVCALEKQTSSQLTIIAESTREISNELCKKRTLFDEIVGSLQDTLCKKAEEIK